MKSSVRFILPVIASIALLIACQKQIHDALSPLPPEEIDNTDSFVDKSVKASFQGRVLNEEGQPLKDATVKAGGSTVLTDEYGIFFLSDVMVSEEFSYIQVEKAGYLLGSRTLRAAKEAAGFVEIQLIKKELKGSFDAKSKASIKISEGTLVDFPERAIVREDGTEYNGIVNVYGTLIDPPSSDFSRIMPGDLRGLRTDNSISALISYGMVTAKLEGEAGEKLQLLSGKTATINMTISESLRSSAPQTIPMWHFDESTGIWKEEGKGVKVGNSYRGEVSHFSTWNFDKPETFAWVSLQLISDQGSPVPYTAVSLYDDNGSGNISHTDGSGKLNTWVMKSVNLNLKVISRCNSSMAAKRFGPVETDTDLGQLELQSSQPVQIHGSAVNCHQQPVMSGNVRVIIEGLAFKAPIVNGAFVLDANICSDNSIASIVGFDGDSMMNGEVREVEIFRGINNIGELSTCKNNQQETGSDEYIEVTYPAGGEPYRLTPVLDSLYMERDDTAFFFYGCTGKKDIASANPAVKLKITDTAVGIYNDPTCYAYKANGFFPDNGYNMTYEIVKFGNIGHPIHIKFEGVVRSVYGENKYSIKGELWMIRRN